VRFVIAFDSLTPSQVHYLVGRYLISNLHWNGRRNNFVLKQVRQPVEGGGVELERQVLSLQVNKGLGRPRDLLLQRHGRVLEGGVTQHVVVVRRGR